MSFKTTGKTMANDIVHAVNEMQRQAKLAQVKSAIQERQAYINAMTHSEYLAYKREMHMRFPVCDLCNCIMNIERDGIDCTVCASRSN